MAEAVGIRGIGLEDPGDVEAGIAAALLRRRIGDCNQDLSGRLLIMPATLDGRE